MILLTVGKQLPFDRLSRSLDNLAPKLETELIGQIGKTAFVPRSFEAHASLAATAFEDLAAKAQLIVSHAGIGSILLARRLGKPIVIVPRRASLAEHRNDHQLATAKQLLQSPGIFVAWSEKDVGEAIVRALKSGGPDQARHPALESLQQTAACFVSTGHLPAGDGA